MVQSKRWKLDPEIQLPLSVSDTVVIPDHGPTPPSAAISPLQGWHGVWLLSARA